MPPLTIRLQKTEGNVVTSKRLVAPDFISERLMERLIAERVSTHQRSKSIRMDGGVVCGPAYSCHHRSFSSVEEWEEGETEEGLNDDDSFDLEKLPMIDSSLHERFSDSLTSFDFEEHPSLREPSSRHQRSVAPSLHDSFSSRNRESSTRHQRSVAPSLHDSFSSRNQRSDTPSLHDSFLHESFSSAMDYEKSEKVRKALRFSSHRRNKVAPITSESFHQRSSSHKVQKAFRLSSHNRRTPSLHERASFDREKPVTSSRHQRTLDSSSRHQRTLDGSLHESTRSFALSIHERFSASLDFENDPVIQKALRLSSHKRRAPNRTKSAPIEGRRLTSAIR